jgi:adaptin ear-binding coat-associated protein 1/2
MASIDPMTGQPLPASALQRILYLCPKVLVYNIPPLPSTKGHQATLWTADPSRHIFTGRLRVVETSVDAECADETADQTITAAILLEDTSSGSLFAACPYTSERDVEPVVDSSRFFAVTVRDPTSGKKAVLGIGFEERTEAFDFGVALQEVWKAVSGSGGSSASSPGLVGGGGAQGEEKKRDLRLKEGETITVSFGGKFGRRARPSDESMGDVGGGGGGGLSGFSLPPPPSVAASSSSSGGGGAGSFSLPPPPKGSGRSPRSSAYLAAAPGVEDAKHQKKSAQELGFDDGQFGEFA